MVQEEVREAELELARLDHLIKDQLDVEAQNELTQLEEAIETHKT